MKTQTKQTHTRGPWKFNVIDSRAMIEGRDQLVAYVDQVKVIDGHLLAAAPELLAILKHLVSLDHDDMDNLEMIKESARELIAKAEGK